MCGRAIAAIPVKRTHDLVKLPEVHALVETAKSGTRSVCIIPGSVIIPESWKQAKDALPEFILITFVARNSSSSSSLTLS